MKYIRIPLIAILLVALALAPAAGQDQLTVTFGPPVVNGKAPKKPTAEAIYPKGVPDYADTVAKEGSLVVTVGTPVEGREKRRVKLIEAEK